MKIPKVTLAYRAEFASHLNELNAYVDAYELMPEHFVYQNKKIPREIREKELIAHTFQLCVGNEILYQDRIQKIQSWLTKNQIQFISDHLAANFIKGVEIDNFYPIDLRNSKYIENNINILKNCFGQIILENPAVPFFLGGDFIKEAKLFKNLYEEKGIQILLDINNLYINAKNFNFNPAEYLEILPVDSVRVFHMAGFEENEDWLVDGHMCEIDEGVWELCTFALKMFSPEYIVLERDHFKESISSIISELKKLKNCLTIDS